MPGISPYTGGSGKRGAGAARLAGAALPPVFTLRGPDADTIRC
jgi:hypothetical protein